jgi:peptidyl-dipeptidase Dcp
MTTKKSLNHINIRTSLLPGDIGYVIHLHGYLYQKEYDYGITFETYVANGLIEFYNQYDQEKDAVWICEHDHIIIGFLLLIHRENNTAQLRYFILEPGFRGIGLGKALIGLFMQHVKAKGFKHVYLWTTHEQEAAAAIYKKHGFKLKEKKYSEALENHCSSINMYCNFLQNSIDCETRSNNPTLIPVSRSTDSHLTTDPEIIQAHQVNAISLSCSCNSCIIHSCTKKKKLPH